MTRQEERDAQKERWQKYRNAATALYPIASINQYCAVSEVANKDGAFLEVIIWVPRSAIERPQCSCCQLGKP